MRKLIAFFLLLGVVAVSRAAYRIENIPLPPELRGGISSVAFTPAGSLVLATRYGEIWMRAPDGATWRCFARGLNEPLGLVAESERVVYVAHRPELLRIADTDGDGKADAFDALGGDWGLSNNYHEFFFGLRRDHAGNFYGAVSLTSYGDKAAPGSLTRGVERPLPVAEKAGHGSDLPLRGWAVKITPDGTTIPIASGFRQPNGVGMSPDDEMFVTDNQGDYKPSCGLLHVAAGDFHGHAESLKWEPGFVPGSLTPEKLWRRYKGPAVVFPHGAMGVSSGEPIWDLSGGKFGPFGGQIFVGDFTSLVMRMGIEKVAGEWQGFVFPFLGRAEAPQVTGERLAQGGIRAAFAPDGSLYIGQTGGWGGGADGVQRVTWDGRVTADVRSMQLTPRGFALTFTKPMDKARLANPANYELDRFRFYYHVKYGSPWIDEAKVPVSAVRVADDGLRAEVELAELKVGFVYEIAVSNLRAADGEALANPIGYYTANRLLNGEIAVGGTTRLPRADETSLGAKESPAETAQAGDVLVAAGEKTYRLFCVACHQNNGKGLPGGAANFVDDKTRLAKPDAELMQSIFKGVETKGMPAFGATLTKGQQRAVLAYIRATFGEKAAGAEAKP